jgi:hypothetical protein
MGQNQNVRRLHKKHSRNTGWEPRDEMFSFWVVLYVKSKGDCRKEGVNDGHLRETRDKKYVQS